MSGKLNIEVLKIKRHSFVLQIMVSGNVARGLSFETDIDKSMLKIKVHYPDVALAVRLVLT